ncbi:MAG: hypothetical protein HY658_02655 [Actinobacteria bacterium]|nr:hypothetical protein [Actinomycetota bacterium]
MGSATQGRRVVAVTDGSLLTLGLASVLREQAGIDVVTVNPARGRVYRQVREARPDVVIIANGGARTGLPEGVLSVQRLLEDNPRSTVIALSLVRPEMEVFRARRVRGATVEDLLQALEGARSDPTGGRVSPGAPKPASGGAETPGRREGP